MRAPKQVKKMRNVPIYMPDDLASRLDAIAEKADISRNQLTVNLITVGIEEIEAFDRFGMIRFIRMMEQLRDKIRGRLEGSSAEVSA